MKTFPHPLRSLAIALFTAISVSAFAYDPLPPQLDGSMMPYDFAACRPSEVPDSLQPFFITYVSRHGARFLSSEKKVEKINAAITKARNAGSLTPLGEQLETLVKAVTENTDGRWGALDSIGAYEQQRLARQMAEMWPTVTKDGVVNARATYVPRVVMSMYEFAHSLCTIRPDLDIFTAEGHQFDDLLRYFKTNPAYIAYLDTKPWKREYDEFVATHVSPRPAQALFGEIFDDKENRDLTLDLYGILQSLRAAGLPAPDTRWMTEDEYRACWEANNLEHYYARTLNPISEVPAEGAVPLLNSMLSNLTNAVQSLPKAKASKPSDVKRAELYFGHAETLMPLLSLCDVEGCNAPNATPDKVADEWKDYEVVPLGANFEITLMTAPSGTVYALTRLNGCDVKVGPFTTPLVKWSSLLSFLTARTIQFQ